MFRVKVAATLTLLIAGTTALAYFTLPKTLEAQLLRNAQEELALAATSQARHERLEDFALTAKAREIAEFSGLRESLTDEYTGNFAYQRHLGVYNKGLLRWKFVFENLQKERESARDLDLDLTQRRPFTPDLLFVTDDAGSGVAALGQGRYDWYNVNVAQDHPTVLKTQLGTPLKDTWRWRWSQSDDENLVRVGLAPIQQGSERFLGVVVVGVLINDGAAQNASRALEGRGVAYFVQDRIYGSTLSPDDEGLLAQQLFPHLKDQGPEPAPVRVHIQGRELLALARYHSANASGDPSGFIILADVTDALTPAQELRNHILLGGLALLILALSATLVLLQLFIRSLEEIDRTIQEVVAGNRTAEFRVSGGDSLPRDMARSLNLLSAALRGERMPDEDDEEAADWGDLMVDDVTATSMMRAINRDQLHVEGSPQVVGVPLPRAASSPDADKRLYEEYVTARKNLGEDVSELDFDGFSKRLEKNRQILRKKHNARDVGFTVVVRDGKVVLKPEPIL